MVVEHDCSCVVAGRSLGLSGVLIERWKDELEAYKAETYPRQGKRLIEQQSFKTARNR
ncbi:MAG: hypothetical protein NPIRA01_29210 [Nitrospirales bacterium]|nr:MAG: hypothetical protein NPIRA01_29210 [Nitrospirales bacterium]